MPKTPTQWTPESSQPSNFTPYGSSAPTVFTLNDGSAPTNWSPGDTKNPTSYTPRSKNPTTFNPTFGIKTFTYDTLGSSYDDSTITYDQVQQNVNTPAVANTNWSPA